jgi:outer membrane protein TolC
VRLSTVAFLLLSHVALAEDIPAQGTAGELSLQEFIESATRNDGVFEQILIDAATLAYTDDIELDAEDLLLSLKSEHGLGLPGESDSSTSAEISLERLFRNSGTTIGLSYGGAGADEASSVGMSLSQDIARNAFGRAGRMKERRVAIRTEIARHQIIEAYEDYMASLMTTYYAWYEAYEKLRTAESSYADNLKLLENIKERRTNNVARDVDVNKISVQVIEKRKGVVTRKAEYGAYLNRIRRVVGNATLESKPALYASDSAAIMFDREIILFRTRSRTAGILRMLEEQADLDLAIDADELLPSIKLMLSFEHNATGYDLREGESEAFVGLRAEWPLTARKERARREVSRIALRKQQLTSSNTLDRITTDLTNLKADIERERELIELSDEKITLAEAIVRDEGENYSLGKITLNDLIQQVNALENEKLTRISHMVRIRQLLAEWRRMTDRLITRNVIPSTPPRGE